MLASGDYYHSNGLTLPWRNMVIDPRLERYLELCQRIYERMERDGSWPWKNGEDSTLEKEMIDSEDTQPDV